MKNIIKCIGWVLFDLIIQLAVQFGMSFYAVNRGMGEELMMQWIMDNMLLMTLLSNMIFILAAIYFHKIRKVNISKEWKMKKISAVKYIMPCIVAFLFSVSFSFFTRNTSMGNALPIQASAAYYNGKADFLGLFLMIANLLILAPIAEELLCRGIMVSQLEKRFSAGAAVVISSLIFGLIHIPAGGITLALAAAVMGLILGIVYVKTESLYVSVAAHCAANLPDFIFPLFPQISDVMKIVLTVATFLLFLACILLWLRQTRAEE